MRGMAWALAALALSACLASAEGAPSTTPPAKETTMAKETSSPDPFEGVFPPAWKGGDRWRVSMRTELGLPPLDMPNPEPEFGDVEFDFRVDEAPTSDDGIYRLEIQSKATGFRRALRYVGKYRKNPFSFVRLEDESGQGMPSYEKTNPEVPYVGAPWGRFLKDFPAMPPVQRTGIMPFVSDGFPMTQDIQRTADGLRFTIISRGFREVIDWKRGAPWWSSAEQTGLFPPPLPSKFLGSGKLLKPSP